MEEAVTEPESPSLGVSASQAIALLTAIVLLLGVVFRARGFLIGTIPLWEDEAAWAIRLVDQPLSAHDIRPLGFMAISKLLVGLLSPSETVLRAVPWLAGMTALFISPLLAKRLFSSHAARLLFVACIALHPAAIDLSKEFKPYSLGLALHMGLLLLALQYRATLKGAVLAWLLGLLFVGTLLSQDVVFTYPGLFALLFFEAVRGRRRRQAWAVALTAGATLTLLAALYTCFWSKAVGSGTTDYWGKKYDVFYVGADQQDASRLGWTAARVGDIAAMPGARRDHWKRRLLPPPVLAELKLADIEIWQVLGVLGVGALLYRRRWGECALLLAPLAVLLACNGLGFWPLGAFRTNLFALVYATAVACMAVDRGRGQPVGWDVMPTAAVVLLPFMLLGNTTHATKSEMAADSAFTEALRTLVKLRDHHRGSQRSRLALDRSSCSAWRYYKRYHPDKARTSASLRHFSARCTKDWRSIIALLKGGLRSPNAHNYVLLGQAGAVDELESRLPPDLVIDDRVTVGKRDQFVVSVKRR